MLAADVLARFCFVQWTARTTVVVYVDLFRCITCSSVSDLEVKPGDFSKTILLPAVPFALHGHDY